jgi:glycosyltransferase involved in cell wall biosynthesis
VTTRAHSRWNTVHITTVDLTAFCFLRSWFRHLREQGHRVTLITKVTDFETDLGEVTDELISLDIPRKLEPWGDLKALAALTRTLGRLKPDVIHTHTSKAGLLGRLAGRLCWLAGANPKIIHTIHELPQNSTTNPVLAKIYALIERAAGPLAHRYVTVSQVNQRQILREQICAPDRLTTIPNGLHLQNYQVKTSRSELLERWGISPDALVIGTCGRLEKAKGHFYFLQALPQILREIPNLVWVCTGKGPLAAELNLQAKQLGVADQIRWLGWVDDLASTIAAFDIFVLPSLYEGQGVVLLEAMAMRRPVICSRVGGTQDVVVHEETGLFVQPRSPQDLTAAIYRLAESSDLRDEYGQAGYERVRKTFLAHEADLQMMKVYRDLLQTAD